MIHSPNPAFPVSRFDPGGPRLKPAMAICGEERRQSFACVRLEMPMRQIKGVLTAAKAGGERKKVEKGFAWTSGSDMMTDKHEEWVTVTVSRNSYGKYRLTH